MPIYAYKCESCGHAKDVLQKMSDAPLSDCPACGKATFRKQLTAAGFQLKGSGWYATDFRNGSTPPATAADAAKPAGEAGAKPADAASAKPADGAAPAKAPAAAVPAPAPASASGSGS